MPDEIDISHLRAKGLQPGEEELPEQQQEQPGTTLPDILTGFSQNLEKSGNF